MNKECISEAFDQLKNIDTLKSQTWQYNLQESAEKNIRIPKPFNKYFEVCPPDDADDFQAGDEIDGYGCHFVAWLAPKEKYEDEIDVYPMLTDDPDYPVVELAGGRLYPVELTSLF